MQSGITRILLLSANPQDTDQLRLNEEFREIREGLNLSEQRKYFDIRQGGATRAKDLRRLILNYQPHIVHFSGHSSTDGVFLETDSGHYNLVTGYALANLFSLFADTVRCVILNACYSRDQAIEIVQQIPYVVGMSSRIRDDSAIQFAIGFYDAIGAGRDIEDAYKFGCNAIQLEGVRGGNATHRSLVVPVSESGDLGKYQDIDEADKPVLLTRVREVKPENTKVANLDSVEEKKAEPPLSANPTPDTTQSRPGWLAWTLAASLVAVGVMGVMLWQKAEQEAPNIADLKEEVPKEVSSQESLAQDVSKQKLEAEKAAEAARLEREEEARKAEEQRLQAEAEAEEKAEAEAERVAEEKRRIEEEAERKQEEVLAQQQKQDEENAQKEAARLVEQQAQDKANKDKAKREKQAQQKQAKEKKDAQERREQAKLERFRQLRLEEEARLQRIKAAQQAEAERLAAEARSTAIARQQAERRRQEQLLQQQRAAEAQRQQQAPQTPPAKQESAADRMAKEVEEFWFNN